MNVEVHRFLRPARLPIPPPRHFFQTSSIPQVQHPDLPNLTLLWHIKAMDTIRELVTSLFAVNSIWSVVFRGFIWLVVSIIIIVSVDNPNAQDSLKNMKANLGFFFMFLILGTVLVYLLFGMSPKS